MTTDQFINRAYKVVVAMLVVGVLAAAGLRWLAEYSFDEAARANDEAARANRDVLREPPLIK